MVASTLDVAQLDEFGVFRGIITLNNDDRDLDNPGQFILPGGCIKELPPFDIPEGYVAIWNGDRYILESLENIKSGSGSVVEEVQEVTEAMYVTATGDVLGTRDKLLRSTDWTQVADTPSAIKKRYKPYRQALWDIEKQEGYPFDVQWPTID